MQSKMPTFESSCPTVVIVMTLYLIQWHVEQQPGDRTLMVCLLTDVIKIEHASFYTPGM